MDNKICTMCNIEKHTIKFTKKNKICKNCSSKRSSKRYYENKDKISNQENIYHEENRDKLLQKQNERYKLFGEKLRNHGELENGLKASGEKTDIITQKNKTDGFQRIE